MEALVRIIIQAPPAIVRGRFDVDGTHSVYGIPARIIGILLLALVVMIPIDLFWVADIAKRGGWNNAWVWARVAQFLGSVILTALVCLIFREKRRDKATKGRNEQVSVEESSNSAGERQT